MHVGLLLAILPCCASLSVSPTLRPIKQRTRSRELCACSPLSEPAEVKVPAEPINPKQALEELGELTKQIQVLWSEGKTWTPEQRVERRREIVGTYVRVFAPAMAFSGVQLLLTLGIFAVVLLGLNLSGRGYVDAVELLDGVPFLGDLLQKIEPSWGNAAIALAMVEVLAPVLIPLAALATPAATSSLQAKLTEWGLDADGLNKKIEDLLERTTD